MLIRIVRMHFKKEKIDEFLENFKVNENAIRNFPGCLHLELLRDADDSDFFCTMSHWDSSTSLENYRQSTLFRNVWLLVKPMFSEKAQAYSLERLSGQ